MSISPARSSLLGQVSAASPIGGAAPEPPLVSDYTLLRPIGKGSYGEVWLAQSATGAFRAIKVVQRNNFESSRPFEREFQGIKRFEPISRLHSSQVDVLHVGRNEACFY